MNRIPDWLIHLGIAYLLSKLLKIKNLSLVLLASILPDISFIGMVVAVSLFKFSQTTAFLYFLPFHTPFILILIALAIAFSTKKPKESFIAVCFGLLLHLILDFFQKGNSIFVFYPFNITPYSFGIFWQESIWIYPFQIFSILLLTYALLKEKVQFDIPYKKRLITFGLIIAILPLFTENLILDNFYYFQFLNYPGYWDGKDITLTNRRIVSENPIKINILEGQDIELVTSEKLQVGDVVAFEGVYKDGKIYANNIHVQEVFQKEIVSLIALILFIFILLKNHPIIKTMIKFLKK